MSIQLFVSAPSSNRDSSEEGNLQNPCSGKNPSLEPPGKPPPGYTFTRGLPTLPLLHLDPQTTMVAVIVTCPMSGPVIHEEHHLVSPVECTAHTTIDSSPFSETECRHSLDKFELRHEVQIRIGKLEVARTHDLHRHSEAYLHRSTPPFFPDTDEKWWKKGILQKDHDSMPPSIPVRNGPTVIFILFSCIRPFIQKFRVLNEVDLGHVLEVEGIHVMDLLQVILQVLERNLDSAFVVVIIIRTRHPVADIRVTRIGCKGCDLIAGRTEHLRIGTRNHRLQYQVSADLVICERRRLACGTGWVFRLQSGHAGGTQAVTILALLNGR